MHTNDHFLLPRCTGMNCGATDANHSPECRAEHAAAVAGGRFVMKDNHIADEREPIYQARSLQEEEGRFRDYSKCAFDSLHPWLFEKRTVFAAPIAPRASYGSGMIDAMEDFVPVPAPREAQPDLRMLGYELEGVLIDVANDGFDKVCLETVRRVRTILGEAAAPTPERADAEKDAALTDEQIIEIFQDHYTEEPGDAEPGHILPFARAILAADKGKK
jgi:hypothetical protein